MQQAELKNLVQLKKEAVSENLLIEQWDHLSLPPQAPPHPQNENHNHRKLIKLIAWTTALSNSMKLCAMLCRATQDEWVMVESSDKIWSTGEGNVKPPKYSCLENPMNTMEFLDRGRGKWPSSSNFQLSNWNFNLCKEPFRPFFYTKVDLWLKHGSVIWKEGSKDSVVAMC